MEAAGEGSGLIGAQIDERAAKRLIKLLTSLPTVDRAVLLETDEPRNGTLRTPNVCFLSDRTSVQGTILGLKTIHRFILWPRGLTSRNLMLELIRLAIDIRQIYAQVMAEGGFAIEGGFTKNGFDNPSKRGLVSVADKETIASNLLIELLSRCGGVARVIPGEVRNRDQIAGQVSKEVIFDGDDLVVFFHGRSIEREIRLVTTVAMNPVALEAEILSQRFDLTNLIRRSRALALARGESLVSCVDVNQFIAGCREMTGLIGDVPGVETVRPSESGHHDDASLPSAVQFVGQTIVVTFRRAGHWQKLVVTPESEVQNGQLIELAHRIEAVLGLNGSGADQAMAPRLDESVEDTAP